MRRLMVRVKPGSHVSALTERGDGTGLACVKSPPVDGKANDELRERITRAFGVRKAQGIDPRRRIGTLEADRNRGMT